jgi:HEAT repeat protein
MQDQGEVMRLIRMLKCRDINLRWKAARQLTECGESALEPLLRKIYDDDTGVRLLAIWVLGKIGSSQALGPLRTSSFDEDECIQEASLGAIDRISRRFSTAN